MEKKFGFSSGPHYLATFSLPILAPEIVDQIVRRYSHLPPKRADAFYAARIEQEIAQFNITMLHATYWVSILKAALVWATK